MAPRASASNSHRHRWIVSAQSARILRRTLGLTGFPVGVAPVALSFTSRFVRKDACNAILVCDFASFDFSSSFCRNGGVTFDCLCCDAFLFIELYLLAFSTARFSSFSDCKAFRLPGFAGRLGCFLGSPIGLKEGRLCVRSSAAAVGEFTVSDISQISIPVEGFLTKVRTF
jgi:hypothetical protein